MKGSVASGKCNCNCGCLRLLGGDVHDILSLTLDLLRPGQNNSVPFSVINETHPIWAWRFCFTQEKLRNSKETVLNQCKIAYNHSPNPKYQQVLRL